MGVREGARTVERRKAGPEGNKVKLDLDRRDFQTQTGGCAVEIIATMAPKVNLIVAVSENMGIGSKGTLPWRLKKELQHFGRLTRRTPEGGATKQNAVVMGRRTWESIPDRNRPLPGRRNVVLSSRTDLLLPKGVDRCATLEEALSSLGADVETAWIIGGTSVYSEALQKRLCDRLYVTRILHFYDCDAFLPMIGPDYRLTTDPDVSQELQEEDGIQYKFEVYEKDN